MAAEVQQGGKSSFHLGRQPNANTIISNPRELSRFRRQFTEFALDPSGETQQSQSIGGSIFGRKSQAGRLGGTGRIGTEVFTSGMLDYVQAILNGDPETQSRDVSNTTVYDGKFTPVGEATGVTTLKTIGDSPNLAITQPTTPSQLEITVANGVGDVVFRGARKTGLSSLDLEPIEERVTLDSSHKAVFSKYFHQIHEIIIPNTGQTINTAADLDIIAKPRLKSTVFRERIDIFAGLTVQGRIGKEYRLGMTGVPTGAQLTVADNIRLSLDLLFRAVWRRKTVAGGPFQESLVDTSDLGDDPFIPNVFFPDYGGYLVIDDEPTLFDDYSLNFNLGIEYLQGKSGERQQSGMQRADSGAEITGSITLNFKSSDDRNDTFIRWDQRYKDNEVSKIELYMFYWRGDGKQYMQKITLFNVELSEIPTTPVNTRGNIKEQLSIRAIVESRDPVIEWEVHDDDGWFGVTPKISFAEALAAAGGSGNVTIDFGRPVTGLAADDFDVTGATKGALDAGTGSTRTLALTNSVAGELKVILKKNAVAEGNDEVTEVLTVV